MELRTSVLLIALCSSFLLHAQAENRTDAQGRKQGEWARTWESTGKLRYTGRFKDDRPVGEFKHYDERGVLTTVQVYATDGKVSRAKHYHPDGTLMATGKYVGQEKDSVWNYYSTDGRLRRVEGMKQGVLHGEQLVYYANGQLAEHTTYRSGVRNGEHQSWFDNGNPRMSTVYRDDQPDGTITFHHPNGRKEIEGKYVDGLREGTWYYFNADGSLQLTVVYKKGEQFLERKENGTFTEYWDDDRVKSQITYKKGKREGPFVEYHNNGQWAMRKVPGDPIKGVPAFEERVLQGQTKAREGTYVNDLLEGDVREYDEKGRTIRTTTYAAGEVVKTR